MEILNIIDPTICVLTLLYIVTVGVFISGWRNLTYYRASVTPLTTKVSVIVAARNEEASIGKTLNSLLAQTYNKDLTELIFIDDHSTDGTADIIKSYEDDGVRLIQLRADKPLNSYKKKAIQTAIGQSSGVLIVTTDADCLMGVNWLSTIVSFYEEKKHKMISSPVVYNDEKSIFEYAQSLEFLYLIGLGAATIGNGKPATCNGANLAYEKEAFYEVGGFSGIDDLASGDDELLLHKMAAKFDNNVGFLKNREALVYTHAKPNLAEFIQQRKRWSSKSTRYKNKSIIVLGVFIWLFNLAVLVSLGMGVVGAATFKIAAIQLFAKMLVEFIFLYGVTSFVQRRKLLLLLPLVSVLHVLYIIYIGVAGNSGKYNWKGRMVR